MFRWLFYVFEFVRIFKGIYFINDLIKKDMSNALYLLIVTAKNRFASRTFSILNAFQSWRRGLTGLLGLDLERFVLKAIFLWFYLIIILPRSFNRIATNESQTLSNETWIRETKAFCWWIDRWCKTSSWKNLFKHYVINKI